MVLNYDLVSGLPTHLHVLLELAAMTGTWQTNINDAQFKPLLGSETLTSHCSKQVLWATPTSIKHGTVFHLL